MTGRTDDVWQKLAAAEKPVVLYGTGDGADKILEIFKKYGIKISGVFASDGFVRRRTFHGMKVLSYAGIKALLGEFIAVIAFASSIDEVIRNMYAVAAEHETYAPDVPAAGDLLFDSCFYRLHKSELDLTRSMLSDPESVFIFDNVIRYKLSGSIGYLRAAVSEREKIWTGLLRPCGYEVYCDLGAYNGDTIRELYSRGGSPREIYAFEPDPRSFRRLAGYCKSNCPDAHLYKAGAWSSSGRTSFSARGSRSSGFRPNSDLKPGGKESPETELITLDSVLEGRRADYIKYDVEGTEFEALAGSSETIKKYSPDLCVSLYHRSEDLFRLPLYIKSLNAGYKFFLRRFRYVPAWDLNLYCVK